MRHSVVSLLLISSILPPGLFAQQSTARLLGTVKDPTGAVVAGVTVTAHNVATSQDRRVTTDETGGYSIAQLPIGEYTVSAEAAGFKTSSVSGLTLQVGQE